MKPPYAIGSVPSLSGHAIAYRWRSLPRVRRHRASKAQGSSERVLPWQITMDQLIFASLSHTHYWYEVGMLKVPAMYVRMQCSVLLYSLLYNYCCTAVWRPPPPQCSYCSRHRLSGRRSYLHPQFTAQLVGACSYWHLGTEHVFLWPCAYYYYFLRLKFLTTKFLTGDAVCSVQYYLYCITFRTVFFFRA